MASKYWVKLYHEILDDPKMGTLSDHLYRRVIELFLLAGENNEDGSLPKVVDMAWRLRVSDADLTNDLESLEQKGIVCQQNGNWKVTHFEERQAPMEKAEYMRRLREQEIKDKYYDEAQGVTNGNDVVTEPVTHSQSEEKRIDTEQNRTESDTEQEYIASFCEITKIPIPNSLTHYSRWIQEVGEWINLGVTRADIKEAVEAALTKKYTVARPASITSFLRGNIAENEAKQSAKKTYLGPDGEEIVI
jgi:DNA-binding transcriptional regulator YhcF (GntR family)